MRLIFYALLRNKDAARSSYLDVFSKVQTATHINYLKVSIYVSAQFFGRRATAVEEIAVEKNAILFLLSCWL